MCDWPTTGRRATVWDRTSDVLFLIFGVTGVGGIDAVGARRSISADARASGTSDFSSQRLNLGGSWVSKNHHLKGGGVGCD
ncbi:MAG: hypothetical protein ABIQ44_12580 [Chloroflexia bacterium]